MDPLTGAVIITGLTTVGKPTAEALTTVVGKILGPSVDAIGQGIAAPLQAWAKRRGERATATLIGAAEVLQAAEIAPQAVPPRLLMPILEHASLEDEDDIQRRWAALLANAASPDNKILPAFAEILHQLTPVQANILQWMYEMKTEPIAGWVSHWPDVARSDIESTFNLSHADYALLITDLERLNLIEPRRDIKAGAVGAEVPMDELLQLVVDRWNSRVKYESIGFTTLGLGFIAACTPPKKST
jgi:hypothetical protein